MHQNSAKPFLIVGLNAQLVINEIQNWLKTAEHPIYIWIFVVPIVMVQGCYWLHWRDFVESGFQEDYFFAPKKKEWFAGPEHNSTWKSFAEIKVAIQEFFQRKKSPLVWMKTNDGLFEQFFVVWW